MSDALGSRGPDGSGLRVFQHVVLAHRRLAIIDLETGAQPIANEDGSIWTVFNGEIYNFVDLRVQLESLGHRFRTRSDTEVLVHAYEEWGDSCISRLRGMFAFALWDETRQRLLLARDRVGIKPLLYAFHSGCLYFASELQAFRPLARHWRMSLQSVDLYLQFQYIPAPFTIFEEAHKLPPAHFMVVRSDGRVLGPRPYWQLAFRPDRSVPEEEWLERLDDAIRDAVRAHLVSDVPFGAFLSGGLDSSMVVAHMCQVLGRRVKTFSIGFDDPEFDERPHARAVAELLGTDHHDELLTHDELAILPALVDHYGEPFGDSSALPTYRVSRLAARHVKMVLSGDGGDESFAGYPSYEWLLDVQAKQIPLGPCRRLRHRLANLARGLGWWKRPIPRSHGPRELWFDATACFGEADRLRLWLPPYRGLVATTRDWFELAFERARAADLCSHLQKYDIQNYLPFDILTKVDIASMCHGLEVRVPLLDHLLLELAAQVPWDLKLRRPDGMDRSTVRKYVLKRTAEKHLPTSVIHRQKRGFSVPLGAWFQGPARQEALERLTGGRTPLREFFDLSLVQELLARNDHTANEGHHLWNLVFLAEWMVRWRAA